MKTSLKDIAEKLHVSKTTVSWVLSGKGNEKGISLTTQERIMACAKEMHYQPNLLARSLHTGLSGTIGLILPDISDSFYSQMAKMIEIEVEKHGYSLMITSSGSEKEREERMINLFRARQVDGIIIAPTKHSPSKIIQMMDERYPFVTFDRYFPELKAPYVIIDNEESSFQLVNHLIQKGRQKIALITTNSYLKTMSLRHEGYKRALESNRIPIETQLYGEVSFKNYRNNIVEILDRITQAVPDVDGFFFTTHILALEAFQFFHERGIPFNQQYGLACIHDTSAFRVLAPQINTARMPIEEMSRVIVTMLVQHIKQKQQNPSMEENHSCQLSCLITYRDN
ncbi:MAG: LacI family DNA-binding transcriptional regulator [Parabacteroides sp.]|nr:LacI family DNA-binding transcriptional regulator [Parabacteroides sp.]